MKEIGHTHIKFKNNDGECHRLANTKLSYSEPYETKQATFTYEELVNGDSIFTEYFSKTKESIFPWGKKCIYWKDWLMGESEFIYPGDTIVFELDWVSENDMSLYELMRKLSAEDFIDYCKDKGISVSLNI